MAEFLEATKMTSTGSPSSSSYFIYVYTHHLDEDSADQENCCRQFISRLFPDVSDESIQLIIDVGDHHHLYESITGPVHIVMATLNSVAGNIYEMMHFYQQVEEAGATLYSAENSHTNHIGVLVPFSFNSRRSSLKWFETLIQKIQHNPQRPLYIYTRVSSRRQVRGDDGNPGEIIPAQEEISQPRDPFRPLLNAKELNTVGLEAQKTQCLYFAHRILGFQTQPIVYSDVASSFNDYHALKNLKAMLDRIKNEEVPADVIIHDISRLGRNSYQVLETVYPVIEITNSRIFSYLDSDINHNNPSASNVSYFVNRFQAPEWLKRTIEAERQSLYLSERGTSRAIMALKTQKTLQLFPEYHQGPADDGYMIVFEERLTDSGQSCRVRVQKTDPDWDRVRTILLTPNISVTDMKTELENQGLKVKGKSPSFFNIRSALRQLGRKRVPTLKRYWVPIRTELGRKRSRPRDSEDSSRPFNSPFHFSRNGQVLPPGLRRSPRLLENQSLFTQL